LGRADLHVHTSFSDGISKPEWVLKEAKSRDLSVIAITDHNTIEGALEVKRYEQEFGVEVIIGEEVSTTAGHIIGLFLEHSVASGLDPAETIKLIHKQGSLAVVPHPFAQFPKSVNLAVLDYLSNHPMPECRPDGLEILSGFPWNFHRRDQLLSLNNKLKLAMCGGSDSHGPRSIGCVYTSFDGHGAADLKRALLSKSTIAHGHPMPMIELIRTLGRDIFYRSRKFVVGKSRTPLTVDDPTRQVSPTKNSK
jgi:hypothetical protein